MSFLHPEHFDCLKGDCPLVCCCGWRIGLDEATESRWQTVDALHREKWFASLDCVGPEGFQVYLLAQDDTGCCRLMDAEGLCTPHVAMGEDYKPETCRRFPEITIPATASSSLSLACPEVGRVLLTADTKQVTGLWTFTEFQAFAMDLFVDWHSVDSNADQRLIEYVCGHIPSALFTALGLRVVGQAILFDTPLAETERDVLRRYFQQTALHLGLPDHAFGGDAVASSVQLVVLTVALIQVLHLACSQGVVLDAGQAGLAIAYIERQWGHPSSGMDLIQREPWLAQLDWREPLLSQLLVLDD